MPISKHRKKKGSKKRKSVDLTQTESTTKRFRIRRHRFREIQNDSNFLALVKIGRAVNAVTSGLQFMSDYTNDRSPVGHRQFNRAFFTTSGLLYEGLQVVTSIRLKYINEPFFNKLNILIGDEYKTHRKIVQEIRHSIAFHLDSDDKSTKLILNNLKLKRYDFISGNSEGILDFYFEMADTIDFNYLINKFKNGRSDEETFLEIIELVTELMTSFGFAGHEFIAGLGEKMNFSEYID